MKYFALFSLLIFFAGCTPKKKIDYVIKIGDRSVPVFDALRSGHAYDSKDPLTIFSEHKGSEISIELDGKDAAKYDGSRPVSIPTAGGDLRITGKPNSNLYLYIVTESQSNGTVWLKAYFRKGEPVHSSIDLPKEFASIRESK